MLLLRSGLERHCRRLQGRERPGGRSGGRYGHGSGGWLQWGLGGSTAQRLRIFCMASLHHRILHLVGTRRSLSRGLACSSPCAHCSHYGVKVTSRCAGFARPQCMLHQTYRWEVTPTLPRGLASSTSALHDLIASCAVSFRAGRETFPHPCFSIDAPRGQTWGVFAPVCKVHPFKYVSLIRQHLDNTSLP